MNMKNNVGVGAENTVSLPGKKTSFAVKLTIALSFVMLWLLLVVFEQALLFRVNELDLFLFNKVYFNEMMAVPAGFLSYIASFMVQFFYYPVLGAALYVLCLFLVYWLTKKVFDIPDKLSAVAMLPVVALLATNTELGYWIFYLKLSGYWYVAVIGVIAVLLATWLFKKLNGKIRPLWIAIWVFAAYPLFGFYALAGGVLMGLLALSQYICNRNSLPMTMLSLAVVALSVYFVPQYYYGCYATVATEYIYTVGIPAYQWVPEYIKNAQHEESSYWHSIYLYWIPYVVLLLSYVGIIIMQAFRKKACSTACSVMTTIAVVLCSFVFMWVFWYSDNNFRIENKQNRAMWEEDWEAVADNAMDADVPTRQIVLNKNIAMLKLGRAGNEAFTYPDGSSEILAPMGVHLTQTGGKMVYYQYGKFNFCYRWCVEDAVEYGWCPEYLKHAARSMLLSGEYRLAERYINILKSSLFYASWATDLEECLKNPELMEKKNEFFMPLQMKSYPDELAVDESFVEVYLSKNLMNLPEAPTPMQIEAALLTCMIRKDTKAFWYIFEMYMNVCKPTVLPKHYQEAFLLFLNLDKGQTVKVGAGFVDKYISMTTRHRFDAFIKRTTAHKGKKEDEMAPFFKDDFGDTYLYFYFFVRKIKTN